MGILYTHLQHGLDSRLCLHLQISNEAGVLHSWREREMTDSWTAIGSALASLLVLRAILRDYLPTEYLARHFRKIAAILYPYVNITFPEHTGTYKRRNEAYSAIESYLKAASSLDAKNLMGTIADNDTTNVLLSMDANEELRDHFRGVELWWSSTKTVPTTQVISFYSTPPERRSLKLTFRERHRNLVVSGYLPHVMTQGREIALHNRQRKLYTNNPIKEGQGEWSDVKFEHPGSFDTLALDPTKKKDIMADLDAFRRGKEFYARIGKAWKRGYLLYGPPGTGKSTMIAAMANYMDYNIYDIELTIVKTNTELRRLLIETSSKSIIVIEDIDCSLDLSGKRSKKPDNKDGGEVKKEIEKEAGKDKEDSRKVTLSGLLNFIDGLWSSCGSERLIVFTTNHIEKLDLALIRRGRMDKHIEMSYCGFEAFKVLAKNYLEIESHPLFGTIEGMLKETKITPADVAENLMPKFPDQDPEICLTNLIEALKIPMKDASGAGSGDLEDKAVD